MQSGFKKADTKTDLVANRPASPSTKASLLSCLFISPASIFNAHTRASHRENSASFSSISDGWTSSVKRIMASGSIRRIKEQMLGLNNFLNVTSSSDIWLLGVRYTPSSEDSSSGSGFAAFVDDFSSRILVTYRKGYDPIGDSKYTSDAGWGCMLRSSQMLVAQALVVHRLGRSWRKSTNKELDRNYVTILQLFGDFEESLFSIHNLVHAGKTCGLASGSWMGPYAMCRTWETLVRSRKEVSRSLHLTFYVVSGDEDGERGGAPVLCIEDVYRHCGEHAQDAGEAEWLPLVLLVPLVLGLDKVNPRYVPSLAATFTFPQSVGILGGRPGASTYIVGVQDGKAFYLDPHETQQAVKIKPDDLEADTSSYHCNVVRHFPLDTIDPSLAIGFYCRDKEDFDDFCSRASRLANESNGAPLFTVARVRRTQKPMDYSSVVIGHGDLQDEECSDTMFSEGQEHDDDWQFL